MSHLMMPNQNCALSDREESEAHGSYDVFATHLGCVSPAELNGAFAELLGDLHARPFKKLSGCRASAFRESWTPQLSRSCRRRATR